MASVQDAFKHNRAKRNAIIGSSLILVCITLLSCVSSFSIYKEGFNDTPKFVQWALSLFAVVVVEGAFIWLLYGFARAFSSLIERVVSLCGMVFIVAVMATNIITHFMMVKSIPLAPFQQAWLSWGAVSVFIAVLVIVLVISMADPLSKLVRQELRIQGKQQSTILYAREDGIESDVVQRAMLKRAQLEGNRLADQIIGETDDGYLIWANDTEQHANLRTRAAQATFRRPPAPRRGK